MRKQEKDAKYFQKTAFSPLRKESCQLLIVDLSGVNSCHIGY